MADESTNGEDEVYTPPRRTPHPDETPISPYDTRELRQLEEVPCLRDLLMIAKKIRTTEAQLEKHAGQIGKSVPSDPRDLNININRMMLYDPKECGAANTAESVHESYVSRRKPSQNTGWVVGHDRYSAVVSSGRTGEITQISRFRQ